MTLTMCRLPADTRCQASGRTQTEGIVDLLQLSVVAIVVLADLGIGVLVLVRNPRSMMNRLFALSAITMCIWLVANFMCDQPAFYSQALVLNRFATASGLVLAIPLVAFTSAYPFNRDRVYIEWWFILAPFGVFALLSMFSNLVVAAVETKSWGTNVIQGPAFPYLVGWGVLVFIGAAVSVVRKYRRATGAERAQSLYLFLGLGIFVGSAMLLGAVLPLFTGTNELAKLVSLATIPFLGFTSYSMIRHRLMDVQVLVVLRGAMYTLLLVIAGVGLVGLAFGHPA